MDKDLTQPSLLSRVRDPQDQAAWREFEEKYRELLLCYAQRRGLQPADAEDVRQIVMLNLSRYLRGFEYDPSRGRFRSYLGRLVRSAIAKQMARRGKPEVGMDTAVEAAVPGTDVDEIDSVWEEEWMSHHYRLATQALEQRVDPRSLEVFNALVAGESIEDAAARFEMTVDGVHKVKQRMRDRLKSLIAEQIRDEDEPQIEK